MTKMQFQEEISPAPTNVLAIIRLTNPRDNPVPTAASAHTLMPMPIARRIIDHASSELATD